MYSCALFLIEQYLGSSLSRVTLFGHLGWTRRSPGSPRDVAMKKAGLPIQGPSPHGLGHLPWPMVSQWLKVPPLVTKPTVDHLTASGPDTAERILLSLSCLHSGTRRELCGETWHLTTDHRQCLRRRRRRMSPPQQGTHRFANQSETHCWRVSPPKRRCYSSSSAMGKF